MSNQILKAALYYSTTENFSVLPVGNDKRPIISSWKEYQDRIATPEEIVGWWEKYPDANVGIITGSVSNLAVIDIDTDEGLEAINTILPDSLSMPRVKTPSGGQHLYFRCPTPALNNNTKVVPGCDLRCEGGFVVAPPSAISTGGYRWENKISEVGGIPDLPQSYINYIENARKMGTPEQQSIIPIDFTLEEGARDNTLFHIANTMIRGGASQRETEQVLNVLARNCNPPFPEREVASKVSSAMDRAGQREINVSEEIRKWICMTEGNFTNKDCYTELGLIQSKQQATARQVLKRLVDEGVLNRGSNRDGVYRRVMVEEEVMDWKNASTSGLDIRLLFDLNEYVLIQPKNIIVVAGVQNAGKTCFLLNMVDMNMEKWKDNMFYFSSEMSPQELKTRLTLFRKMDIDFWDGCRFIDRSDNFADVIRPDGLNFIDFIEIHDEFYLMGKYMQDIHNKLNSGVAVIAIQKNRGAEFGRGGSATSEKARLYLNLEHGKIQVIKAKNTLRSIHRYELDFKIEYGSQFIPLNSWHPAEEKEGVRIG